ncbi:MAG: formylglycine-generating enzyme family protein, partial [Phycisphaerae bacterium]|nr:formylglycine-generating enzyme family protein [Phycisphaerae bacterium]
QAPDDLPGAGWTINGEQGAQGSGDSTLVEMPTGEYSITWNPVAGYITPAGDTQTLAADGMITFEGTYVEDPGPAGIFILIPSGTFTMGAPSSEYGSGNGERPQHSVTLSHDFYLLETEVTYQQYAAMAQWAYDHGYVTATSSSLRDALDGSTEELLDMDDGDCEISYNGGVFSVNAGKEDHPVMEVTWYGSAAYCDWLSLYEGLPRAYNHSSWQCNGNSPYTATGYRLPAEAEWEYACRAGSTTPFNTGGCLDAGTEANYNGNNPYTGCPSGPFVSWTVPVGSYPDNAWGLYDMHGNLFEWCNDWYDGDYYNDSPGSDPVGPLSGSYRVLRGGFWGSLARSCRSAHRYLDYPDNGLSIGIRPARSAF